MLKLSDLLSFALGAAVVAQSPLQTNLTPGNQGSLGGGLYFNLQVHSTVSITRLDTWVGGTGTVPGSLAMEVWLGPSTYLGNLTTPAMWGPIATATATGFTPNPPSQLVQFDFATPLVLGPGDYGVALRSQLQAQSGTEAWNHAYSNGVGCTGTSIPGSCANTVHSTAELTVRGGAAQNTFFSAVVFTPRMWSGNLHYTNGGTPITLARVQEYGTGCLGGVGLPALTAGSRPALGQSLVVDVTNPPAGSGVGVGFWVMGLSNTAWYYLPLPLDLAFVGMPGCRQYTDIVTTNSFVTSNSSPDIQLPIANTIGLVGQRFYLQAVLVDPSATNPVGMVTTNGLAAVIGH